MARDEAHAELMGAAEALSDPRPSPGRVWLRPVTAQTAPASASARGANFAPE